LVVRVPGVSKAGTRSEGLVETIDLFPTLASLVGIIPPEGLDGVSLAAAITDGASPPDRPVFCDALTPRWGPGTEFRMVRQGRHKVVRFRNAPPLAFDLEDDPGEQHNLLVPGQAVPAPVAALMKTAEESMDFDAAEIERTQRDGDLRKRFEQKLIGHTTGNLYFLPNGMIVNADDPLYHPTVAAESAEDAFGTLWQEQNRV